VIFELIRIDYNRLSKIIDSNLILASDEVEYVGSAHPTRTTRTSIYEFLEILQILGGLSI
jgi:hypothetical protein